ncbi:hypothetical protein KAR91_65025 [Candidatus Pacearchaeota archaeon]|nr:hypothetical protein [Candidatus Pacearchaeota archaeon]
MLHRKHKQNTQDEDSYIVYKVFVRETPKAKLFKFLDRREIWIPKSVIKKEDDNAKVLIVPSWFAKKNGLASDW